MTGASVRGSSPLPLTFRHRAGVTPYTSASALAGSCVFGKQSHGPVLCARLALHAASGFTLPRYPFSRSYGVNLPSSLTRTHPSTLVLSHPATRVGLRYGRSRLPHAGFSWRPGSIESPEAGASRFPTPRACAPKRSHCGLRRTMSNRRARPTQPRTTQRTLSSTSGHGISTVCPSPTPLGLGLGPTNPTRINLPSEPSAIRWARFSRALRYSCRHSHSCALHRPSQDDFTADTTLPYHSDPEDDIRSFGSRLEPRYIVGARSLDQ